VFNNNKIKTQTFTKTNNTLKTKKGTPKITSTNLTQTPPTDVGISIIFYKKDNKRPKTINNPVPSVVNTCIISY